MQTKIFIDTGRESWDSPKGATGNEFGLHVRPGSAEMGSEKELLEAFERIIHQDFPNPQRIGCPEDEALLKLAGGSGQVYQTPSRPHPTVCSLFRQAERTTQPGAESISTRHLRLIGGPLADRGTARSQPSKLLHL